ncbi:LysR family transcriptional regulator [Kineococcus xinjiangensis]|uniref:LysR family transcriptional regulator n=1 Tax=Kineococcus xinjiangensis TaxID=512762 RepID=UPI000CEBBDA7|nr:LysR family transcriptional regulator [Kineococcus xinjiangensis]
MPLSPHLPELSALELLVDTARTGSIGAAARIHGISQQAASARLRGVEALVGAPLLLRSPRGSRLTESGTVLVEWAARLIDVAAEVDQGIATLRADRSERLRVAASMTVAEHLLPRWLITVRARQQTAGRSPTAVTLTATNSDRVAEAVRSGEADLGFVEGPTVPAGLRAQDVARDELVVVVAPSHPWTRRRAPLTAQELAATALVAREEGSGTRRVLEEALAAKGLRLTVPAVELTTSTGVREAVRAGSAPAVLSRLAAEGDLGAGRLAAVPVADLDLSRRLRAVWAGSSTPPAGAARDLLAVARSC